MKLSQQNYDTLRQMPKEQITEIVYGGGALQDDGDKGLLALLLGGHPQVMKERAQGAANLYLAGRVPYIMPTGGVKWDTEFGHISEADCMKRHLMNMGVPEEAILLENQATTTRENMLFGAIQMERHLRMRTPYRVYIVTAPYHLHRSMLLARTYLPRTVIVSGYAAHDPADRKDNWHLNPRLTENPIEKEVYLLKSYIDNGEIEDFEF